ncbi:long-chain fatty acid--CoA ligase [Fictibacillus aquaticus]|uniref:Long-chain fatty acid--CoA ligase n=1 Tax=Fictibacillus aquaticus TaxID=2021314 RepID=A0A235F794_9BACL|nr:long-chain fatty acid--CoA ligase [Fictibacillus aquaticus]OYD57216.1 long-chain fatty acid--CoA ligase [Fictibacillus aquaticus]
MHIGGFLTQNARNFPERFAVECEGRSYTYGELNTAVNRLAHGLISLGVKKGDKVAIVMKNSDHFMISFFAAAKIGAVVVPVNFRLTANEIQYIFSQSDTVLVLCDSEFEETVNSARETTGVSSVIVVGDVAGEGNLLYDNILSHNEEEPNVEISEHDDLEILYTSGTTGRPKGALFDHDRIFKVSLTMLVNMELRKDERFLHLAPLFHSAQLNLFMIAGVILGGRHYIHRDFHPVKALQAIQDHEITHLFAVPAMYNFMLQVPNVTDYDLSSIRRCGYGAAPMPPELVRKSIAAFKTDRFFNLCGLTEAGPGGILLDPEGHEQHLGKSGKAGFLTEARVVHENGEDVKPGVVGEFILRSETVMKEYYKKPEETKSALKNGWLYTGDLATVDEEGYISLVDRKKDMIISGGENVYSAEVEAVLYEHPAILDAAIIGLPDEVWGEAVTAIIVLREGAEIDEQELKSFCRQKLAGYKVPRRIFIEPQLPRNASGKILKYQLRQKMNELTQSAN